MDSKETPCNPLKLPVEKQRKERRCSGKSIRELFEHVPPEIQEKYPVTEIEINFGDNSPEIPKEVSD